MFAVLPLRRQSRLDEANAELEALKNILADKASG